MHASEDSSCAIIRQNASFRASGRLISRRLPLDTWMLVASFCCVATSSHGLIMPFPSHTQGKSFITFCFCAAVFFFSTFLLPRSSSGLSRAWSDDKANQRPSDDVALIVVSETTENTTWLEDAFPAWRKAIYLTDAQSELHVPANKGRESIVYLTCATHKPPSSHANTY